MAECPLRNECIIDVDIAPQRLRQMLARAEAAGRQDLTDAPVEALDHAVGLGMARRDGAVLKVLCGTDPVEAMLARRFALAGGSKAIGELLAVIGQDLADPKGGSLVKIGQEALGASGGLFRQDLDINPARGAVEGDARSG